MTTSRDTALRCRQLCQLHGTRRFLADLPHWLAEAGVKRERVANVLRRGVQLQQEWARLERDLARLGQGPP